MTLTEEQQAAMTFVTTASAGSSGGSRGDPGKDGRDGRDGKDGAIGPMGPQGPKGDDGRDGMDGPRGKDGMMGERGLAGNRGDDGRDGMDGSNGRPGPAGDTGPKGDPGQIGPMGPKGDTGPAGEPGTLAGGHVDQLRIGSHVNPGNFVPPLFVSKKDYREDYDDTNETISNTINSWYTNQNSALYLNSNPNASRDIPINNGPIHISNQPIDGISIVSAGTIITEAIVLASDERIKYQISPLDSSSHMLDNLVPVTYLLRTDHPNAIPRHGFIAQNVEDSIPGSVTKSPNWVPSIMRWCDVGDMVVPNGSTLIVGPTVVSELTPLLSNHTTVRLRTRSMAGEFKYYSCDSVVSSDTIHVIETVLDAQPCDVSGNPLLKYDSGLMQLVGGSVPNPEYVIPVMDANGTWTGDVEAFVGAVNTRKIFIWGHEVMDFHNVDMMSIISILTDSVKRLREEVHALKR